MSQVQYDRPRRSSRVFMRLRVAVSGRTLEGRRFREACETIVINAHGALLYLNQPLADGELLVLTNLATQEEQECRVVYLGDAGEKGQRVGVEFVCPAPHFWGIEFAQPDWPPRTPAPSPG